MKTVGSLSMPKLLMKSASEVLSPIHPAKELRNRSINRWVRLPPSPCLTSGRMLNKLDLPIFGQSLGFLIHIPDTLGKNFNQVERQFGIGGHHFSELSTLNG